MAKTHDELKAFFETGDKPTEAEFADFIDSCLLIPENVSAGNPFDGIIKVSISANVQTSAIPAGEFGKNVLAAETTASGSSFFGIATHSTFGKALASAANTAAGQAVIGGDIVGIQLWGTNTTAEALGVLDLDTDLQGAPVAAFGKAFLNTATTAAAQKLLDVTTLTSAGVFHSGFGAAFASAASTAAGQTVLGGGTFGVQMYEATTTASAVGHLALAAGVTHSTFGVAIASAATTAAGQLVMGGGTAGIAIFKAANTAAVVNQLGDGALGNIGGVGLGIVLALG
jgi:hypothetical protein